MFHWIELFRLSNAPTVASNVLAGVAIGLLARLGDTPTPWVESAALIAGVLLIYSAGMVLNDVFDVRVDAQERPARPIPSGRVRRGTARVVGLAMLTAGTALLAWLGHDTLPWAVLLAATVLLYDTLHRQIPASWLLLGLCRGVVIVIAARATSQGAEWGMVLWVAGGLFAYVACFSAAARDEMRGLQELARFAAGTVCALALFPLGLLMFDLPEPRTTNALIGGGILLVAAVPAAFMASRLALSGRNGVPAAVGGWIGVIPLLDAAVCMLAGQLWLGIACVGLWGLAGAMRTRVAAS